MNAVISGWPILHRAVLRMLEAQAKFRWGPLNYRNSVFPSQIRTQIVKKFFVTWQIFIDNILLKETPKTDINWHI